MNKAEVKTRMNRLKKLSDGNLLDELKTLRKKEKTTTLEILLHLIEVSRRNLHVSKGYSSMFDYCLRGLGYSESAANLRVHTARCISVFPEVYALLERGEANLSTVSCVAGVLTAANKGALLTQIRGKSRREVEQIVAQLRPQACVRERVKPVVQKACQRRTDESSELLWPAKQKRLEDNGLKEKWQDSDRRRGGRELTTSGVEDVDRAKANAVDATNRSQEVHEQLFELRFAIDSEGMEMLEEIKLLLSTKHYLGIGLGELMKAVMACYLDHHSPKRKRERRRQQARRKENAVARSAKNAGKSGPAATNTPKEESAVMPDDASRRPTPRYIPAAVRGEVYERDGGRCTFVGADGVRCDSSWCVQYDHIHPWALGGDHSATNVRLLCATHNQLVADRAFGRGFMEQRRRRAKE